MVQAHLQEVSFDADGRPFFPVQYEANGSVVGKEVYLTELEKWNDCRYELVLPADAKDPLDLCGEGKVRRLVPEHERRPDSEKTKQDVGGIRRWLRNRLRLS